MALDSVTATGKVRCVAARIGGDLDCGKGSFENAAGGVALSCARISVQNNIYLNSKFYAWGEVKLAGARVGGSVLCTRAYLRYNWETGHPEVDVEDRCALSLAGAQVGDYVAVENTTVDGFLDLRNVLTGNYVSLCNVCLERERPNGVTADGARISGELRWEDVRCNDHTTVVLTHARVGRLLHDGVSWPGQGRLRLRGFTYGDIHIDPAKNGNGPPSHAEWLRRQNPFEAQPYEQLSRALRRAGYEKEADQIGIAKHDERLRDDRLDWWTRAKGRSLGISIRYGYGLRRVVAMGVFFWIVGTILFEAGHASRVLLPTKQDGGLRAPQAAAAYPPFFAPAYSLDALLPVIDLHQESYWLPSANGTCLLPRTGLTLPACGGVLRLYLWFHIICGWTISTLLVVGLTGLVRKR